MISIKYSDRSLVIETDEVPKSEPFKLADGKQIPPGTVFSKLGSKTTSAGFKTLRMFAGNGLRYVGMLWEPMLKGNIACFRMEKDVLPPNVFFAFYSDDGNFYFSTPSVAGRRISLDNVRYVLPPK